MQDQEKPQAVAVERVDAAGFWAFSLRLYARPRISPACLELQDRFGASVNFLLLAAWMAQAGQLLSATLWEHIIRAMAPWEAEILRPVRQARRSVKGLASAGLYENFKALELKAEAEAQKRLLAALADGAAHYPLETATSPHAALKVNLQSYLLTLGRVPAREADRLFDLMTAALLEMDGPSSPRF